MQDIYQNDSIDITCLFWQVKITNQKIQHLKSTMFAVDITTKTKLCQESTQLLILLIFCKSMDVKGTDVWLN